MHASAVHTRLSSLRQTGQAAGGPFGQRSPFSHLNLPAQEAAEAFQAAMAEAGEALIRGAELLLAPGNARELGHGGALEEFAQLLCSAMGCWGEGHLGSLAPERRTRFLQLVRGLS